MEATFTYSSLPDRHIRVLEVVRHDSEAVYKLHHKHVDDTPRFRAISYTWGSPTLTHSINCNEKTLRITTSVFELLSSTVISSLIDELPIWIDAICINQADNEEKAVQVRNMDHIYSLAEEVIVWLGPASSDSDLAMDTIRAMSEKKVLISPENTHQFMSSKDTLQHTGLANTGEEVQRALGSLLCRRWFQRLWVFQEVALARQRQVVCGSKVINWDDFALSTMAIGKLETHRFSIIFPDVAKGVRSLEGLARLSGVAEIFQNTSKNLRSAFLLDIALRKDVTDPRDRVFGILGLASVHMQQSIEVDYSKQDPSALLRLYIDCGKACIEDDEQLPLLYMLSGRAKNPGLPSWCPDLGASSDRNLVLYHGWKAGIKTAPLPGEELPTAWFEPDCDDLYAPGCRVDIVDQVVDSTFCWSDIERGPESSGIEDAANNLLWNSECLALLRQTSLPQCEVPISYLLTICEGFLIPFGPDPKILREVYERTIFLWRVAAESTPYEDTNQSTVTATYYFFTRVQQSCQGRKFFRTRGGRFGMGPPETRPGDNVYILYGAGPLYLIRFNDDSTQVLGDVYIHELMDFDETPEEVKEEAESLVIN